MTDFDTECKINAIDENTWMITDFFNDHMYLLEGEKEALLIDTGVGSLTLSGTIRGLTEKPLTVALSHGHVDHIGATGIAERVYLSMKDFKLYEVCAKPECKRAYCEMKLEKYGTGLSASEKEAYLDRLLQKGVCGRLAPLPGSFELGDRTVEVISTPGHTEGSVCFFDHRTKALFSGDTICDFGVLLNFAYSASVEVYFSSIQRLRKYPISGIYCGHHQGAIAAEHLHRYETLCERILRIPEAARKEKYEYQDVMLKLK